jgi:excinuclease UvrABC ATPase subunit
MSWEDIISAPIIKKDIYEHYESLALQEFYADLSVDTILGVKEIKNTIYVDQSSIGKTPRSCPATFIGTFDKIRQIFAGTTQAKYL